MDQKNGVVKGLLIGFLAEMPELEAGRNSSGADSWPATAGFQEGL